MVQSETDIPTAPQPYQIINTDRQMAKLRFSACGKLIVAAGRDATLRRWELPPESKAMEPLHRGADPAETAATKPSPPPEWIELPRIHGHNGWVTDLVFHGDQKRLFSADSWGRLVCWDYTQRHAESLWQIDAAHQGWIRQLALSPDGRTLASCSVDQKVCLWSTCDGNKLQEVRHTEDLFSVAFHPDGTSLVSGDQKGNVVQWDLEDLKPLRQFDAQLLYHYDRIQDVGGVRVLAFDREGKTLAVAGAKPESGGFVQGIPTVLFFDWQSGAPGTSPTLGTNKDVFVHDLVCHRDGYWIGVTSGQPGEGQLFMLRSGEPGPFFTHKLANCHSLDIHPGGVCVAVIGNAGTFGQSRSNAKQGEYQGNWSPIHLWKLPTADPA